MQFHVSYTTGFYFCCYFEYANLGLLNLKEEEMRNELNAKNNTTGRNIMAANNTVIHMKHGMFEKKMTYTCVFAYVLASLKLH